MRMGSNMALNADQQNELKRMSGERRGLLTESKLEKRTVTELKARVNILSVSETVNFAPENNYSAQEMAYIEAVNPRLKWVVAIPVLLDRAAKLEAGGLLPEVVTEILKAS